MSLMLVDAAGLYFRAFYGVPESVRAPDGAPVNAIRGFLDMTSNLIERRRPSRWVACLDEDWRPAFRVALVPSYKAHRVAADGGEEVPPALAAQVPLLLELLAALGMTAVGAAGFEADDVIATLAATDHDICEVVTGDRDLLALATDRVRILYTGKGVAKLEEFGPEQVEAKYGIPAGAYADFAVLRGDPSDGLPGVTGVGEKTAAALVMRFGSVEQIVAAALAGADGFPTGSAAKVLNAQDYLARASAVVRGRTDVPIPPITGNLPQKPEDEHRLLELTDKLGLERSVNRLLNVLAAQRSAS